MIFAVEDADGCGSLHRDASQAHPTSAPQPTMKCRDRPNGRGQRRHRAIRGKDRRRVTGSINGVTCDSYLPSIPLRIGPGATYEETAIPSPALLAEDAGFRPATGLAEP